MATKIEGWVDQFVAPEGYSHSDGEHIYVSKGRTLSMDHPVTVVIHEGKREHVYTASEVQAMLDEALGRMAIYRASGSVILVEVAKSRLGITLEHP